MIMLLKTNKKYVNTNYALLLLHLVFDINLTNNLKDWCYSQEYKKILAKKL